MNGIAGLPYDPVALDLVFGMESTGADPQSRAMKSTRQFVRSQVQVAPASDRATGRRLLAREALQSFGWDVLLKSVEEGSCPLVSDAREPALTLKARREALRLTVPQVAVSAGVTSDVVHRAETQGELLAIRDLERIAQSLALDERVLGYVPNALADGKLGVRLRELSARAFGT